MRKINMLILGFSLLFSTCNLEMSKGSLPIVLPKSLRGYVNSRNTTPEKDYDYARIYLKADTGYFNIDKSTKEVYVDVAYSAGSYTIRGLEPGEKYTVYVYFGYKEEDVLHSTTHYAISEENFKITSGINNEVKMNIFETEVTWLEDFKAKNIKQVLTINKSDSVNELYCFTSSGEILDKVGKALATNIEEEITSIGKGYDLNKVEHLWINTTTGILQYANESEYLDLSINMEASDLNIAESQGVYMNNNGEATIIVYFQGQGIIGGTRFDNTVTPEEYNWYGKDDLEAKVEGIEDMIKDLDKIIYDFVSFDDYAYVATALPLPSFSITGDVMDRYDALEKPEGSEVPSFEDIKTIVNFINVWNSTGKQVTVKSLAAIKSSGMLYMGSDQGLYYTNFNTLDGSITASDNVTTMINNTEDENIIKLENGKKYIAALTDNGVIIIKDTSVVKKLDFYMGLPENISDITWLDDILFISGSSGLVSFDATGF